MPADWFIGLRALPVARAGFAGIKLVYERIAGKAPVLDFRPGGAGVELHIHNPRAETIVIEAIEAKPPMIGISVGDEIRDIARAIVTQRGVPDDDALAVLTPGSEATLSVITFDPFPKADPKQVIKVRLRWRSIMRRLFSESSVSRKLSVQDIRELQRATEARQPRITVLG
ncbi:MAG TPA: hypothetical protein VH684_31460 [Xanthobacteraceae bacterium]